METIYDWLTVGLFAGLIVLFLQRSSADEPSDSLIDYLIAATGCAVVNYIGNEEQHLLAGLGLAGLLLFIHLRLRPFERWSH